MQPFWSTKRYAVPLQGWHLCTPPKAWPPGPGRAHPQIPGRESTHLLETFNLSRPSPCRVIAIAFRRKRKTQASNESPNETSNTVYEARVNIGRCGNCKSISRPDKLPATKPTIRMILLGTAKPSFLAPSRSNSCQVKVAAPVPRIIKEIKKWLASSQNRPGSA